MVKKTAKRKVTVILLVAAGIVVYGLLANAGSLEPSAVPAPTMKTLVDVEPRTAIRNMFNTLTPIVINQSGSYYLAEDILAFPSAHGINITADNVTLDLNGFTVYGNTEVGSWDGIHAVNNKNITVMNGTVQDFFQDGVDLGVTQNNSVVINVRVLSNLQVGLRAGSNAVIRDCIVFNNTQIGIETGSAGTIIGCVSRDNGGDGIKTSNAVIENCTARSNGGDGIVTNVGSVIRGCTVAYNTGDGIDAQASLVQGNATFINTGTEIVVSTNTLVDNHESP